MKILSDVDQVVKKIDELHKDWEFIRYHRQELSKQRVKALTGLFKNKTKAKCIEYDMERLLQVEISLGEYSTMLFEKKEELINAKG